MNMKSLLLVGLVVAAATSAVRAGAVPELPLADQAVGVSRNVSIAEADQLLQADKRIVLLDVRTPNEFAEGHLPGALNVDFYEKDFQTQLGRLDRDKTYLVYCKAGGRSAKTQAAMKNLRFKSVLHLNEGFDQWQAAGKAVQK